MCRRKVGPVAVLEAEDALGRHQTGHNSGVIHSGLYYRPGSLKAQLCAEGREAMYRFCEDNEIPVERCGKLVVATVEDELPYLEELERRGRANGLKGVRRLGPEGIKALEPYAAGRAGLFVPETGIVDYGRVVVALSLQIREAGSEVLTGCRLDQVYSHADGLTLRADGRELQCRYLVNCAGLQSDRVAALCGARPKARIVPIRGEYYTLPLERRTLVRNLIYPVPLPGLPFLGVHFTRMIDGAVEVGPNAVLAFKREGYRRGSFSARDAWAIVSYRGFWRMAARYRHEALAELIRAYRRPEMLRALQRLVPELQLQDLVPARAGIRAQAIGPNGDLIDDFVFEHGDRMIHVLNAPSPGATASLTIGQRIAATAISRFDLD